MLILSDLEFFYRYRAIFFPRRISILLFVFFFFIKNGLVISEDGISSVESAASFAVPRDTRNFISICNCEQLMKLRSPV